MSFNTVTDYNLPDGAGSASDIMQCMNSFPTDEWFQYISDKIHQKIYGHQK